MSSRTDPIQESTWDRVCSILAFLEMLTPVGPPDEFYVDLGGEG